MKTVFKIMILIGIFFQKTAKAETFFPFGMSKLKPSINSTVKIVDLEIGIKASQVCGYTDWTTAMVKFPKEILSKTYWENISKQVIEEAKRAVVSFSGALPSMLACNISPTFCQIMNHAEMLANFEFDATIDSCSALEGIGAALSTGALSSCIKSKVGTGLSAGKAREACILKGSSSTESVDQKNNNVLSQSGFNGKDHDRFLSIVFDDVGQHSYTKTVNFKNFSKEILPGFSVSGSGSLVRGGTFQRVVERKIREESNQIHSKAIQVLKEMAKLYYEGFSFTQIKGKLRNEFEYKEGKENVFFRKTYEKPDLIISPEFLFSLVSLVDADGLVHQSTEEIVSNYSKNASYTRFSDEISTIYSALLDKCSSDPRLGEKIMSEHCKISIDNTRAKIGILKEQRENEAYFTAQQDRIKEQIAGLLQRKANGSYAPSNRTNQNKKDKIEGL